VTDAPLVRADMRQLPIRPRSIDLTVNLFTSFGYFDKDSEHTSALAEMVSTVRPQGWFVIDFLNPASVRRRLVPEETVGVGDSRIQVSRSVSADGRYVCKSIRSPKGRHYSERVRLFEPEQMTAMLATAGVEVRYSFGDYQGGQLARESERTILLGQVG
jgi:hypothetical protein